MHRQVLCLNGFVFADVAEAHDGFDVEFLEGWDYCVCEFGSCAEGSADGCEHVRLLASDGCGVDEAAHELRLVPDADVIWVADVVLADRVGWRVVGDEYLHGVFDVGFGEAFARVEEPVEADGGADEVCDVDGGKVPAASHAQGMYVAVGDDCIGFDLFDVFSKVVVSMGGLHGTGRFHFEAGLVVVIDGQRKQDVDKRSGCDDAVGVLVPPHGRGCVHVFELALQQLQGSAAREEVHLVSPCFELFAEGEGS